ncbi:MAG TPA: AMIN domain-containing protein [Sulfuricurvum sp.]|nr:AMIN domain-containing protein [Sulfuricurvum sp.]
MNKTLLLSSLLVSILFSRENPFFSTSESQTHATTSQKDTNKPPLTSMSYDFPNHSRVLKEVTFTFQNLDGSMETRTLEIDQSIDWRAPLILSQGSNTRPQRSISAVSSPSSELGFIQFSAAKNHLSIVTKDPMIRNFSLSDPSSIVVDFKHNTPFKSYQKELLSTPFTHVKVTNHGKFARTTITLDGQHMCKVSKTAQGASVICK